MRQLLAGTLATAALGTVLMVTSAIPAAAQVARPQSALGMSGGSDLILVQNREQGGGGDRGARSERGGGSDRGARMERGGGGNERSVRMERSGGNDRSRIERSGGNDRSVRIERSGRDERSIRVERSVRGERNIRNERTVRIEDRSRWSGDRSRWSNNDRRHWSNNWRWRRDHGRHNGVSFGIGFASAPYYAPYDYQSYPYVGDDAVAYCMSRYQSYDPASGTYLGLDGLRHPCP